MKLKFLLIILLLIVSLGISKVSNNIFFQDLFNNLDNWENFNFSSGKKPTEFSIIEESNQPLLQIISDTSSSGLICKYRFNPNHYPLVSWQWKVANTIPGIDGKLKEGDDYPIRIFVMFEKDSAQLSFWDKLEKSALELITGYDLPHKSLCYVWANSDTLSQPYYSPYSNDVLIIPLQAGSSQCNQWLSHEVNIISDYKKFIDTEIPNIASVAISGDTDNIHKKTTAFLKSITIQN